jgi:predicted DNA-binding transcriptional regulator YafY
VEFLRNIEQFEDAIERHCKAAFYRNQVRPDGSLERVGARHRVSPVGILCANAQYYLVCCKDGEQMLRHYRVDRLTDAEALPKEPAADVRTIPGCEQGFHLAEYAATHSMMFSGRQELIVLRMPAPLAGYVRDAFGPRAELRAVEDGEIEARITGTRENVRFFALQYGPSGCRVLQPQALREQLRADAAAILKLYDPAH